MTNLTPGSFIVWFAHYGGIDWQPHPGPLEAIVEWVAGMSDENLGTYDEHGIPLDVEQVGTGVVDGFDDMVEAYQAQKERERKAYVAQLQQKREAKGDQPLYKVCLRPPEGVADDHLNYARRGVVLTSGLTNEEAIANRDSLEAVFGRDRVSVVGQNR